MFTYHVEGRPFINMFDSIFLQYSYTGKQSEISGLYLEKNNLHHQKMQAYNQ